MSRSWYDTHLALAIAGAFFYANAEVYQQCLAGNI
jgi:hypothetical protein